MWKVARPDMAQVALLTAQGYGELTARVLVGRGYDTPEKAETLLSGSAPLVDPFAMKEMDRAVAVIRRGLEQHQRMAIFGDYDVDGITATCLLADYLRGLGADCLTHIPGRLEEGYGLNAMAIQQLKAQGVELIITVDCGITALEEAELCHRLGITLVVTDHHECKDRLPAAAAVLDPHRPDATYPHKTLCGVGVAFKLAAALHGDQEEIARRYCDLFCLGTIADVMPLVGENRNLVMRGIAALQQSTRPGIRALIAACSCDKPVVTASTIGYVLAPRINAAGRMEHAELAVQLFLTRDPQEAELLAQTLCRLNRERQSTEQEIYREAVSLLKKRNNNEKAIVLEGENWHQGVVGIVASRLSEEFCRPAFLICLSGDRGKASSRSYGGFNLFAALSRLSPLLEGYGGHELAAGFTIQRDQIEAFRRGICQQAEEFSASGQAHTALDVDGELPASLLTLEQVSALEQLEPCGTGCVKPVFCMSEVIVESIGTVGGGKHLRLKLRSRDGYSLQAIFFSAGNLAKKLYAGARVDIAFHAQINEYRSVRSVQLSLVDLSFVDPERVYNEFCRDGILSDYERGFLSLKRQDVALLWNYLKSVAPRGIWFRCQCAVLCRNIAQQHPEHSIRTVLPCLDVLRELGLIELVREGNRISLRLLLGEQNPLENSRIYQLLRGD